MVASCDNLLIGCLCDVDKMYLDVTTMISSPHTRYDAQRASYGDIFPVRSHWHTKKSIPEYVVEATVKVWLLIQD